jgi:hypothetical protein
MIINTISALSLSLTIYFGNQIPSLITNFQPPSLVTAFQKPTPSITAALKRSKVATPKAERPAPPTGLNAALTAAPAAPEQLASEAPALPTGLNGLAAAQLPADLLPWMSGQTVMPTLASVKQVLTGVSAPTNLTAQVN